MPDTPTTPKTALTEYVILESDLNDDRDLWLFKTNVRARSAEAAIRSLETAGVYVAIPARSFRAVKVTAQVQTTLTIAPA